LIEDESRGEKTTPDAVAASSPVQFSIRDVLLWMTALSPILALSRFGIGSTLVYDVLHAIVLVVALWAALGQGLYCLRWPLLVVCGLIAGVVWADFHIYSLHWWSWFGGPPPWFSSAHLEMWYWHWEAFVPFLLAGGMLASTLLIFRVRGYRLGHDKRPAMMSGDQPRQP